MSQLATKADQIYVRSHVARDLLQNAALFKTDKLVVWEYVANGLQYVDPGTNPVVSVILDGKKRRIVVTDNGRGMDWAGLQNFFIMHGENIDRREGRAGRGRFGTGKSAAFGIADVLRITTVRRGSRSKVELKRSAMQAMSTEDPIPVRTMEREVATQEPNGTIVEIEDIHLKSLDQSGIIRFIERHLARWPKNVTVLVNNRECEWDEPPVYMEKRFKPDEDLEDILGDVELVIKISKAPLEQDLRGVSIYAKGVWCETTLAGSEGREMSQFIYGEIDVPRLDEDKSPIPPFDLSRSMQLNANNVVVQAIYAFLGQNVEEIRRQLVQEEKRRKSEEEARRLVKQAEEIAQVINEDFDVFRQRLAKMKAKGGKGTDLYRAEEGGGDTEDDLLFGSEVPARIVSPTGGPGSTGHTPGHGTEPPKMHPQVAADPAESPKGRGAGGSDRKQKPRGGFQVKFDHMGVESYRAHYLRDERTIYVNLDHPQVAAAKGLGSTEDPVFRRLAYEVAFSEYAVALASELAARDEYIDPSDPIVDIRETLNRLARRGAELYSQ